MAGGLYGGTSSSAGSLYGGGGGTAPAAGGSGGAFGFFKNLANDVKGAVVGFPTGVVHLAEHPISSFEQMGKATWSTWSPLFHGQVTKFGQGVYEHPLAPLLDIASVVSLGVGTAARIGAGLDAASVAPADLAAAGDSSRLVQTIKAVGSGRYIAPGGKLAKEAEMLKASRDALQEPADLGKADNLFHAAARTRLPNYKILRDPGTGKLDSAGEILRRPLYKNLSQNPARRMYGQGINSLVEKLPDNMQGMLARKVYEKALRGDQARRAVYRIAAEGAARVGYERAMENPEALAMAEAKAGVEAGHFPTMDHTLIARQLIEDGTVGNYLRKQLAFGQVNNLADHAPLSGMSAEHAASILFQHHESLSAVIKPLENNDRRLNSIYRQIDKLTRRAQKAAALRTPEAVQAELDANHAALKDMYENGYVHREPVLNSKGEPALNPTGRQIMERNARPILERQRNIRGLERELTRSQRVHANLPDMHAKLDDLHQQKIDLEQRNVNDVFAKHAETHESFLNFNHNLARYATKSFSRKAFPTEEHIANYLRKHGWQRGDGSFPIVPRGDAASLGREAANGYQWVRSLGKYTNWWKTLQIKLSAKTLVNNSLANHIIAMFRHSDPITAFKALYHAHRLAHGTDFADQLVNDALLRGGDKGWLMHYAGATLHNDLIHGTFDEPGREAADKAASRMKRMAGHPMMYKLVGNVADRPVRLGAFYTYVTKEPEVQWMADRLIRAAKLDGRKLDRTTALDQAAARVLKANPGLRDRADQFATSIAGDYLAQSPREQAAKTFIPFYLWDRHIAKSGSNILLDTPIRAALMQQVSQQGLAEAEKYLGNLPDFLQGAIPLQMLGLSGTSSDGRMNAVVGPSLNPFGTLGEFAGVAESLLTGGDLSQASDVMGQVNPFLTGAVSAASGKDIITGTSLKGPGGILPNTLFNIITGLPQEKIVQSAVEGPRTNTVTASGKVYPKLYSQNELAAISNFLGVPIKQISPSTAQYEYTSQQPKHKKAGLYG